MTFECLHSCVVVYLMPCRLRVVTATTLWPSAKFPASGCVPSKSSNLIRYTSLEEPHIPYPDNIFHQPFHTQYPQNATSRLFRSNRSPLPQIKPLHQRKHLPTPQQHTTNRSVLKVTVILCLHHRSWSTIYCRRRGQGRSDARDAAGGEEDV